MKYLLILMCILSVGCANNLPAPAGDTFASTSNEFEDNLVTEHAIVALVLYDSPEELWSECGDGNVGCAKCKQNGDFRTCAIHTIKDRCVVAHEIDHVLFGDFHKGRDVDCTVRGI